MIAVSEAVHLAVALSVVISIQRRIGSSGSRSGMATRSEAERALGLSQLRASRTIIRPDLHEPAISLRYEAPLTVITPRGDDLAAVSAQTSPMSMTSGTTPVPRVPRAELLHRTGRDGRPSMSLVLGAAALVGVAWGAATSGLQTVLPWPFAGLANAVGPWVAAAFLVGAWTRRSSISVLVGVLVCLGEVAGYYSTSALRGFGINPVTVAMWAATGLFGGSLLGWAGWAWRRAQSLRVATLGAALLGGVFIAEGAINYGVHLRYIGDAVVFCALGALLVLVLGATASAVRTSAARVRGAGATVLWLLVVLPMGAVGVVLLHNLLT